MRFPFFLKVLILNLLKCVNVLTITVVRVNTVVLILTTSSTSQQVIHHKRYEITTTVSIL